MGKQQIQDCHSGSRRVLVTGGAGFIGSHLVEALVERGDQVIVVDNLDPYYSPARKLRNLASVMDRISFHQADICDAPTLAALMSNTDIVVHLAAKAGVRPSLSDPAAYAHVNVGGTAVLLETMTQAGVKRLVNVSSSSVYGARIQGPFAEGDALPTPTSPYACSKRAAELMCDTWQRLHGFSLTNLRLFTVFGPRQRPDMAIHRFTRALLDGRPITLFGDGSSTRDYTYVGDIVQGILAAMERSGGRLVANLGNDRPVTLMSLVDTLASVVGRVPELRIADQQEGDVPMTWADLGVARKALGYQPSVGLREGLERFLEWFENQEPGAARHP